MKIGSSFLPGELIAAFLGAQLEEAGTITQQRLDSWTIYHESLEQIEAKGLLRRPIIPEGCEHNAHMYYILLAPGINRTKVLEILKQNNIGAVSHYVPLHSSPAGQRYGHSHGSLKVTVDHSERLIRLPLWAGLTGQQQEKVINTLKSALGL